MYRRDLRPSSDRGDREIKEKGLTSVVWAIGRMAGSGRSLVRGIYKTKQGRKKKKICLAKNSIIRRAKQKCIRGRTTSSTLFATPQLPPLTKSLFPPPFRSPPSTASTPRPTFRSTLAGRNRTTASHSQKQGERWIEQTEIRTDSVQKVCGGIQHSFDSLPKFYCSQKAKKFKKYFNCKSHF